MDNEQAPPSPEEQLQQLVIQYNLLVRKNNVLLRRITEAEDSHSTAMANAESVLFQLQEENKALNKSASVVEPDSEL